MLAVYNELNKQLRDFGWTQLNVYREMAQTNILPVKTR
jgi:hypothetical protein